jgi:hypothetical protein
MGGERRYFVRVETAKVIFPTHKQDKKHVNWHKTGDNLHWLE